MNVGIENVCQRKCPGCGVLNDGESTYCIHCGMRLNRQRQHGDSGAISSIDRSGWSWPAFLAGPFWYLKNGLVGKGLWLLVLTLVTFGLSLPFVWLYCGARAKGDYYEHCLRVKGKFDLRNL